MSGTGLAVALAGGLAVVSAVSLPAYGALATRQAVAAAADTAAVAAADVARGLVPGVPCEVAGRVSAANGSVLTECRLDGFVATVTVSRELLGLRVTGMATAGPPGGGQSPSR